MNCHIELPWRMIPEQYQGLGMPNFALIYPLASKLSYLQCNWGFGAPHSNALMIGYESFIIEVGLCGDTMGYEYKTHSFLAMDNTWVKNVCELVSYFNMRLHFNEDYQLKPIQQGNSSLMSEFIRFGDLSSTDLASLNIMCMHKKVIYKSDILQCDGQTIKADMLTCSPGHSDYHKFPTQRPTTANLTILNTALHRLSSAFLVLTVKLQEYDGSPHSSPLWLLDNFGTTLHHNIVWGINLYHKVYLPSSNTLACRTWSGQLVSNLIAYGHSNFQRWASVTLSQEGQVFFHSSLACFEPIHPVSGFKNVIRFANQSLWVSLDYNGDGSWILEGMLAQSLIIIHDGSYMREISPFISSAATMIYCTIAKVRSKCTWAEMLTSAGSYHGEILGGIMMHLPLHAAAASYHGAVPPVVVDCDNNGVVFHENNSSQPLPTNQSQADLLQTFKNLVSTHTF
jgi:hypothetical protein